MSYGIATEQNIIANQKHTKWADMVSCSIVLQYTSIDKMKLMNATKLCIDATVMLYKHIHIYIWICIINDRDDM